MMHQPAHVIGLTELEEVSLSRNGQVSGRQGKPSNQSSAPVTRTLPLFPLSSVQKMASHRSLHGTTALFTFLLKSSREIHQQFAIWVKRFIGNTTTQFKDINSSSVLLLLF
jgi:hypothetical protein